MNLGKCVGDLGKARRLLFDGRAQLLPQGVDRVTNRLLAGNEVSEECKNVLHWPCYEICGRKRAELGREETVMPSSRIAQ